MILFGRAFFYIQLMSYACLSICIYTTEFHMMGRKSMILYNIPFSISKPLANILGVVHTLNNIGVEGI